jgi:anti-sigma-K factor RskA
MSGRYPQDVLSGAYVLNAVSDAERAAFEERLRESEQMRSEVTELADTAVALGLAVRPVAPPAGLKANLLAALATTPQLEPRTPSAAAQPAARPGTARRSAEARAALRWMRRPGALLVVAAAAVLLLLVGGLVGRSLVGVSPAEQRQAVAFAELLAAPDVKRIPTTLPGGGPARLVVSERLGRSALVWSGDLPPVAEDRVYELWYMGDTTQAAGLLDPGTTGQSFRVLDGTLHEGDLVGMTVEAADGAAQPTGDAVLVIDPSAAG